ncbi:SDR family NAD(P)-dependent oxidoreductase [Saccharopolyspora erythraea]|uniref:oxidoreductase n=1 Tax=Saccharopolyspora erythraea TaxID=1836 RepID=UPI001BA6F175|nr:oxidoreductase [Saccharopolyspora erythraea]QUH02940.1 SDR family NAD(P)-dependent oxidoreductase [Saccharopolyspora erythraea]
MKTWFITGCSTGFGRELTQAVLDAGDRAVVTARNLDQVADLVDGHDDRALALAVDVTEPGQVRAAVKEAEEHFGGIDVLVNNAGIGYFAAVEESTDAEIRRIFDINVFGLSDVIRAVLPGMRARRRGTIVNFSSIGGLRAFPAVGYYAATKFAVEGLTDALRQEVEPLGITTLLVEPGPFRTDWAGRSANETLPEHEIADYRSTAGVQRSEFRAGTGNEPGDPRRAAQAIITALSGAGHPQRLLLGTPAYDMAIDQLESMLAEIRYNEKLTKSADYDAAEA